MAFSVGLLMELLKFRFPGDGLFDHRKARLLSPRDVREW
jgi:hypothetical protein